MDYGDPRGRGYRTRHATVSREFRTMPLWQWTSTSLNHAIEDAEGRGGGGVPGESSRLGRTGGQQLLPQLLVIDETHESGSDRIDVGRIHPDRGVADDLGQGGAVRDERR